VSAGLTPSWQTGAPVRHLFRADHIEMNGAEVRVGVVRGNLFDSDWGFLSEQTDVESFDTDPSELFPPSRSVVPQD
jgi:hypothetical protein